MRDRIAGPRATGKPLQIDGGYSVLGTTRRRPAGFNRAIDGGQMRQSLAMNNKSLARNNKTGCGCLGSGISAADIAPSRPNQHHLAERIMSRDDVLFWLSLVWFVALCGAAISVLFFWPAYEMLG